MENRKTIDLDIPLDAAERIERQDAERECQCPRCGRLHRNLLAGKPPPDPEIERLRSVLDRCRTVLGNMALEFPDRGGWSFPWDRRWQISHEPLRGDAKNLLPIIDAALAHQ